MAMHILIQSLVRVLNLLSLLESLTVCVSEFQILDRLVKEGVPGKGQFKIDSAGFFSK